MGLLFVAKVVNYYERLDYLQNGVSSNNDGVLTAIDSIILDKNESNKLEAAQESETAPEKPLFLKEQCDALRSYMLTPQEMVGVYSNILKSANLLSSEDPSTWNPKRKERAADNLLQVVINPNNKTFAVDGISGAYKVPSESRSLFDAISVGGFHELEHVNQVQTDEVLSKDLRIAKLKGKRVSMLRESGANFKQREAEKALFGKCKPVSLAYAKALQVIERGGEVFEATQAFYGQKIAEDSTIPKAVVAKEAADRVLRLTRGGGFNSQPISYAEDSILDQELRLASPEVKARAVAVTSLDLVDQARLHKYGLLDLPKNNTVDWSEIIMTNLEPYINLALAQTPK